MWADGRSLLNLNWKIPAKKNKYNYENKNLLGNPPKIIHEPITKIISKQLDTRLGEFTQEELDSVLRKQIEKQQGLKYPQKYGRPGNSTKYCPDIVMPYITKTQ